MDYNTYSSTVSNAGRYAKEKTSLASIDTSNSVTADCSNLSRFSEHCSICNCASMYYSWPF